MIRPLLVCTLFLCATSLVVRVQSNIRISSNEVKRLVSLASFQNIRQMKIRIHEIFDEEYSVRAFVEHDEHGCSEFSGQGTNLSSICEEVFANIKENECVNTTESEKLF